MEHLDPQLQDVSTSLGADSSNKEDEPKSDPALLSASTKDATTVGNEQAEHAAFMPTLHYTSGNDLSGIANFEPQHAAGGPLRTSDTDPNTHQNDYWPTDTSGAIHNVNSLQSANQFAQGDAANQFVHAPDASQFASAGLMAPQHQHQQQDPNRLSHAGTPYSRPTPGTSYGTYEGAKPKRKRASPQQLTLLNNIFEMTYFPSSDLRLAIGKELDMGTRSVQIWFQNRRSLWRAKAQQILAENKARREELVAAGMSEVDADAKIQVDRAEAAARQIADQRANDAVEYAINGSNGSLAYALHGANGQVAPPGPVDDGSVTRDDEAGAWNVLHAFHQARTGGLLTQSEHQMYQQPAMPPHPQMDPQLQQDDAQLVTNGLVVSEQQQPA